MIDRIQELDTQLFLFFNGLNHQFVDPFMAAFSGRWIWVPLYVALAAVVVWRFGWKRGFVIIAMIGIAVGAADYISASIIRPVIQRMRPANLDNPLSDLVHVVRDYRGGRYGFPSCHAANTVALALASSLALRCRAWTIVIFSWALLQCYSRIYLGVHYPGDLLAGATVGAFTSLVAYFAVKKFIPGALVPDDARASLRPVYLTGAVTIVYIMIESVLTHI